MCYGHWHWPGTRTRGKSHLISAHKWLSGPVGKEVMPRGISYYRCRSRDADTCGESREWSILPSLQSKEKEFLERVLNYEQGAWVTNVPGRQAGEAKMWRLPMVSENHLYRGRAGMKGVRGQRAEGLQGHILKDLLCHANRVCTLSWWARGS